MKVHNILVIAPHADDEILGCGASIRKKTLKGDNVFVLIMTNAHVGLPEKYTEENIKNIRNEALKAHKLLDVKETIFRDFPAPMLDQYPLCKISEAISEVLNRYHIDIIYVPHRGDIHIDHKIVFDAAMVACRPFSNYTVKLILAYETLSETEWAYSFSSDAFIPNYFETLENDEMSYKIEAMKCFESQLRKFPSSRSIEAIEALAKFRGSSVEVERAEAFMIMRKIN